MNHYLGLPPPFVVIISNQQITLYTSRTIMHSYCIFLGHQPHLSLAELHAVLRNIKNEHLWTPSIVTFETEQSLDQKWFNTLGGSVLMAVQLPGDESDGRQSIAKLTETMPHLLYQQLQNAKKKATFSFRCLGIPKSIIRSLYRECKQYLKTKKLPSRYIGNESSPAKPGTLPMRGIPGEQSCELVILHNEKTKRTWMGSTCAVQDIAAYTERDMGKPFRDTLTGLMPPKLAQMLLNIGLALLPEPNEEEKSSRTIWDPFCGSGVIALEALHRHMHVLASDISLRAVNGCTRNIEWLRSKEKTPKAIASIVWKQDALKTFDFQKHPDLIITETTLGRALTQAPTKRDVQKLLREADDIEKKFFQNMHALLPSTPIVCTFPVYVTRDGEQFFLPHALENAMKNGYRLVAPSSKNIRLTSRLTLLYLRPDQFVGREVVCLLPDSGTRKKETPSGKIISAAKKQPKKIISTVKKCSEKRGDSRQKNNKKSAKKNRR